MAKLLFTATYTKPYLSGITDYIEQITQALAAQNSVKVLAFRHDPSLPKTTPEQNVTIQRVQPNFKLSKGFIAISYPLIAWQQVSQADQIFINLPQVESIWVAVAARLQHKPLRVIYHCELVFESGFFNKIIAIIANTLARWVCLLADKVIVYTQDYVDHSPVLRGLQQKIIVITPPVDTPPTDAAFNKKLQAQSKNQQPIIGFSGRVSREKGLHYLLDALPQLQKIWPNIAVYCAGPYGSAVAGEADYFTQLQQRITSEQLPVVFLNRLNKAELGAFYRAIDLLVLPSTNRTEAFGLVQAEALLCGTPVVTTNLPGVRVAVTQTNGGRVVPIKNPTALAKAITEILKNKADFAAKKIAQTAEKYFNTKKTIQAYQTLVTTD